MTMLDETARADCMNGLCWNRRIAVKNSRKAGSTKWRLLIDFRRVNGRPLSELELIKWGYCSLPELSGLAERAGLYQTEGEMSREMDYTCWNLFGISKGDINTSKGFSFLSFIP